MWIGANGGDDSQKIGRNEQELALDATSGRKGAGGGPGDDRGPRKSELTP